VSPLPLNSLSRGLTIFEYMSGVIANNTADGIKIMVNMMFLGISK
jgi:hypothetical protein